MDLKGKLMTVKRMSFKLSSYYLQFYANDLVFEDVHADLSIADNGLLSISYCSLLPESSKIGSQIYKNITHTGDRAKNYAFNPFSVMTHVNLTVEDS